MRPGSCSPCRTGRRFFSCRSLLDGWGGAPKSQTVYGRSLDREGIRGEFLGKKARESIPGRKAEPDTDVMHHTAIQRRRKSKIEFPEGSQSGPPSGLPIEEIFDARTSH